MKHKDQKNEHMRTDDAETGNVNNGNTEDNAQQTKECTNNSSSEPTTTEEQTLNPTAEIEKQLKEWQDKYLRLSAEFDNYRKRTLKERMDLIKTAGEEVLINLLPVMDDFERGMKMLQDARDPEAIKQGIELIYTKFKDLLIQKGIKEIDALHNTFDADLHEALTKIPAPSDELKGKVIDVIVKGYQMNEKIIRYSKVVVGE